MPLRLFTPAMTTPLRLALSVTIRPDFRLCFNAHTSRALHSASLRRVHLFGDPLTQLVLRPAPLDAPHTHLITFTRHYLYPTLPNPDSRHARGRLLPPLARLRTPPDHTLRSI